MKGIVFTGDRQVELADFPDPTPGPRDAVVEIRASGMCGSDLHAYRAPAAQALPSIRGHEPCGVVVAVGDAVLAAEASIGDRVMVHHYDGCRVCHQCRTGWTQLCDEGAVFFGSGGGDGAHARYMSAPVHTLVPLPEELSFPAGAAVACGTGTAYSALRRIETRGDHTVAVFGQGPVGLSATMVAAAMGCRVAAVDPDPNRRQAALSHGATIALDPGADDLEGAIGDLTGGLGVDKAIETSGVESARADAVRAVKTWGTVAIVGIGGGLHLDNVAFDLIRRQVSLVGHVTFSTTWQADCARYVVERNLDVDSLFSHRWPLEQADEAYRLFDRQSAGKGWFDPTWDGD